jgi:hypothetical protein
MTIVASETSYQLPTDDCHRLCLTCISLDMILMTFRRRNDITHDSLCSPLLYILVGLG